MTDLSQIPTKDLLAFKAGDLKAVSTPSLMALRDIHVGPQKDEQSYSLGHYAGIAGRALSHGLSGPAYLTDLPVMATNALAGTKFKTKYQQSEEIMTRAGFPQPQTKGQRVASDVITGVTNPMNEIAGPLGYVSSGLGSLAMGATREAGGGKLAQVAAMLAGSAAPAGAATGLPSIVRGLMRGGEESAQNMRNTMQTFQDVGTTPTVGQATQKAFPQWLESTLANSPGGANPILNKAQNQAQEIGTGLESIAAKLSPKSSGEQAGRAIQSGIQDTFIPQAKNVQNKLYDKLDNFVPANKNVDISNTKNALSSLNEKIPGAPNTSRYFQNSKMMGIENALKKDTETAAGFLSRDDVSPVTKTLYQKAVQDGDFESADSILSSFSDGKLPYEAVKKLRTLVGKQIEDFSLTSDVPRSKWKSMYAALSSDMEKTAKEAGPQAYAAFKKANQYTKALHGRIDILQDVIDKNGGPEKIFQAAISGTSEGATTFRTVMRSVPMDGKKIVTATILRRLGRAAPGNQNEVGDVFSANSFLTNWNKLSPEAKATMSGPFGKQFQDDLNKIAKVADNLKRGSKVYANPSGSGQAVANISSLAAFIFSLFSGNLTAAAGIAGAAGTANLASRALTNQKFVRWLAANSDKPTSAITGSLNGLATISKAQNDQETLDLVNEIKKGAGQKRDK